MSVTVSLFFSSEINSWDGLIISDSTAFCYIKHILENNRHKYALSEPPACSFIIWFQSIID